VEEVRERGLPPDTCALLNCVWAAEGSCVSAILMLKIGRLGRDGDVLSVFEKYFCRIEMAIECWEDRKIGVLQ
jgi:hypothetical protein